MRPSSNLLWAVTVWGFLGLAGAWFPQFVLLWIGGGVLLGAFAIFDLILSLLEKKIIVSRSVPARLAVGEWQDVEITFRNRLARRVSIEVWDGLAESMESRHLPWVGMVPARGHIRLTYQLRPAERGSHRLDSPHLLHQSLLTLWQRHYHAGEQQELRVYPNYEPVIRFSLLAMQNRVTQMGILALNRPGVSKEFHQLRDFQEGDVLSQLDWKATSRRMSLISREYRQQRDQTIIFAVDCGRRMRALDGQLTQFDHCLNAILLLSYIAMRQGDSVGVLSFGGASRWLPPLKGSHMMPVLLNHLYDYQASPEPTDFSEATERLMARQKRRALVIFLTNLRSEDASHLLPPLRILKKKHVVLLASLREKEVNQRLKQPVASLDDALTFSSTHLYLEDRARLFQDLQNHGILTLDQSSDQLPTGLANLYLRIKKEGKI